MYIHGRCKDLTPLLVCNMAAVGELMDADDICAESFCNMHNFLAGYMEKNMLVPGQVDRWVFVVDASQFSLLRLPVSIFRQAARELSNNFLEFGQKFFIVNLTWFQSTLINTFQMFLDEDVKQK